MIAIMSAIELFEALERACAPVASKTIALEAGETLFRQGTPTPGLLLVRRGRIALMRWTRAGGAVRIHAAEANETFAEAALLAEACHCDAVAEAPSELALLPRRSVLAAIERDTNVAQRLMIHLATSLTQARRLLELRATAPLTEAAAARLADLADEKGDVPTDTRMISIAADLGVTPPALYRALAALEKAGRISRPSRGRVRLSRRGPS